MIDLSALNDEQRQAVQHGEGPLLVVSAAGSGKTRVLVYRAAHLIDQGMNPRSIMLGTFTKKAAKEMASRAVDLVGGAALALRAGTLHSILYRTLRIEEYPWPEASILDEYGQKKMLRDILRTGGQGDLAEVIAQIGLWKNELVSPEKAIAEDPFYGSVYERYEREKDEAKALDFDDMIVRAVELFEGSSGALERARPEWLLIDEAQDTSTAQWRAIELLAGAALATAVGDLKVEGSNPSLGPANIVGAGPFADFGPHRFVDEHHCDGCWEAWLNAGDQSGTGDAASDAEKTARRDTASGRSVGIAPGNITCVADWRQAIYSWRGARPEAILDFESRFPGASIIGLPRNYRSTPEIVRTANVLIRHCGRDLEDMVATRLSGLEPVMAIAEDPDTEAANAVAMIQEGLTHDGRSPADFAVLYRLNAYSRAFEEALAGAGIPYVVIGSKGFFGRREVTDILAYLRLIADPSNEEALRRIVNRPTRFLGKAYCDAVAEWARRSGDSLIDSLAPPTLNDRQQENARLLDAHMAVVTEAIPRGIVAAIQIIRQRVGYDAWLLREEGHGSADEDRIENLNELENVAERYGADVGRFLSFVDQQLARSLSDDARDRVQLMTIHRAKGLEWPVVFAVGVSEGVLPHARCMLDPASLEEERRLAYVAFTRARDELYVSSPRSFQQKATNPSRFVYEAELLDGKPEMAVVV